MSALVNLTAISPFIATASNIPTIPIFQSPFAGFRSSFDVASSSPPIHLRHHRQKMVGGRRHRNNENHRQNKRQEREEEEEREKKRRSLNIPEYGKAKELRLFNTRQNTFVQIKSDGAVRTGPQSNSIHSIFEVLFWCHLAPQLFKPCSSSPSSFSAILLRFKASNRYLCMNHTGRIYTQIPRESLRNVEDCIFQHEFLANQYDVYYSWRYPNGTWPCASALGEKSVKQRTCLNRWYLGVDKKGKPCTVKTPHNKVKRNTFFIQRWIHDQPGQGRPEYPNPLAGSTSAPPSVDGGIFKVHSTRSRASVFDILLHNRRHSTRGHMTAAEATSSRHDCLNLLKNCDRDERSKEAVTTAAQRRTASALVGESLPGRPMTLRRRREVLWIHADDAP